MNASKSDVYWSKPPSSRSRFLGRGCDKILLSGKGGVSVKRGEAIQWMRGLIRLFSNFCRKGNSVKRSRPFSEPLDSENCKVAVLIPFSQNQLLSRAHWLKAVVFKRQLREPFLGVWILSFYLFTCLHLKLTQSPLGRTIHGQMPVSRETSDEPSAPLVHTNFPEYNRQCKYLMYCIFSCSEAPRLRQTVTVPGLDL